MPEVVLEPVVVLVHGAFAESASWNGVIERLSAQGLTSVAAANPLRSLAGDATYVGDVVRGLRRDVVLVGHSYGGQVITQAATENPAVKALVYVSAFAPDRDESALELTGKFDGSTLGDAVVPTPLTKDGTELSIDPQKFPQQFAADVDPALSALMAVTQRPVTELALQGRLDAAQPAWRRIPSWFVWGAADRNIPAKALRFMGERAGGRDLKEIPGAGHALPVSQPGPVAETILAAVAHVRG